MTRITRPQMFMEMARAAAKRSTCFRLNVGAIIVADNRPVSVGYNGAPSGRPHCTGNECPGRFQCHETVHAELNAIRHVPPGIKGDLDIYITHSPCSECCDVLTDWPINRVFFEHTYRDTSPLEKLRSYMDVCQVTPSGYVIDWFSKEVLELA